MTSVNPNTPTHGNYHNYHRYHHNPLPYDPRLALLPCELLIGARVLDIGCNEGWVSCELAQSWAARHVVGVDIDETLVRMAWKRRRVVWSLQAPVESSRSNPAAPSSVLLASNKRPREALAAPLSTNPPKPNYFPASCQLMFGQLPILPSNISGDTGTFPHNISFRCADWVHEVIPEDAEGYDVILALSVSKWIHLNGGDTGLRRFFHRVYDALRPGGTFVFEPQQWDSYTKARKLDPLLQENAKNLKIQPTDFERLLKEIGFRSMERLGVAGEGRFRRPVELYLKPK